jgi:hypothetical protein
MSIFDWVTSLLGALLLARVLNIKYSYMILFLFSWVLFGISAHAYFNIPTMLGYYIGLNEKPVRKEC